MGTINNTRLATSTPLGLNTGFPFFPPNTSLTNPIFPVGIGLGSLPGSNSWTLFNRTLSVGLFRFTGSLTGSVIAGAFFGFNLGYDVTGQTRTDGTATLTVSNDSAQGGIGFGIGLGISISLRVQQNSVRFTFRDGFTTSWQNLLNTSVSLNADLLDLALRAMRAFGVNVPLERISSIRSTVGSGVIWGLFSSGSRQFATQGSLTFTPTASLSANILPRIPAVGPVISGLKKIGGKIKAGPALNIGFPTTIRIVRLTTESGSYNFSTRSGANFNFNGGPRGAMAPTVSSVQVTHSHTMGFEFGLELKGSVSLWSIFSVSGGIRLPVQIRAPLSLGPFFTALRSTPATAMEMPEVVWG